MCFLWQYVLAQIPQKRRRDHHQRLPLVGLLHLLHVVQNGAFFNSQFTTAQGMTSMASAESEPITGVWGQCPQRGSRGQSPRWGVRGRSPPEAERLFAFACPKEAANLTIIMCLPHYSAKRTILTELSSGRQWTLYSVVSDCLTVSSVLELIVLTRFWCQIVDHMCAFSDTECHLVFQCHRRNAWNALVLNL